MAIGEADRPNSQTTKDSDRIPFHQSRTGAHILCDSEIS